MTTRLDFPPQRFEDLGGVCQAMMPSTPVGIPPRAMAAVRT
jgi:hypothetical protein